MGTIKDIIEILQILGDTPIPTLLFALGALLMLLAFLGKISSVIELNAKRQVSAGIVGAMFLLLGIALYIIPLIDFSIDDTKPTDPVTKLTDAVSGCFCQPENCSGIEVSQGDSVPPSSILEPHAENRGVLYLYIVEGKAAVSGNLWVYVGIEGNPASQSCLNDQLQYFSYNELKTFE